MRILIFVFLYIFAKCAENSDFKSKKPLPFFRRQVEELIEDPAKDSKNDDPQSKMVSFLVKNVKEIFEDDEKSLLITVDYTPKTVDETKRVWYAEVDETTRVWPSEVDETTRISPSAVDETTQVLSSDVDETTRIWSANVDETTRISSAEVHKSTIIFSPNRTTISKSNLDLVNKLTDDIMLYENLSLTPMPFLIERKSDKFRVNVDNIPEKMKSLNLSKDLLLVGKAAIPTLEDEEPTLILMENTSDNVELRRSCIFCNNIDVSDCSYPKNKLIPSILCKNEDDVCYSLHTPFGIVDRGCYNVNNNKTTYVCTCNLCNYLSISELPYLYTKKKDWIDNVIELSRTKRFRRSIFKEMACLRCEVNTTHSTRHDVAEDSNCLEGNIGHVSTQECKEDEICGTEATRSTGYLWRGCVKRPLYNNWMTVCDYDLCNYDDIASIYDHQ